MVLSDRDIKIELAGGRITLDPLDPELIQPASIDLRLGSDFRVFRNSSHVAIDPQIHQPDLTEEVTVGGEDAFVLHPGQFALGTTLERIGLPDDVLGKLEGKSSLGRLGLMIHSTAGYVDPGWDGQVTLELSNVANLPILLRPGMRIGQISFERMSSPVERPYGCAELHSHYQGQLGATAARPLGSIRRP
ncbi:dCTP deaminase [Coriobacterium glomerans PW2]|uniref:dCTP deaminase, dUMP-forming n=1 Tax=Coriobacterium glomerans (strain ATCC 49209 / DSM 20642 / JCM 10262 / PW2) TaxID=700015 RepID=F2N756_CORGP|nr:dCTP deaminase [Coriobacterium glomerans]AEB06395.1 dCTP deaminase [Coriobacterium glomerans PW2]